MNLPLNELGCQFARVPLEEKIGALRKMPGAARTVYEFLHRRALRTGSKITVRDRIAAEACGIVRRTFQKGLRQLQAMGLIERMGRGLNRVIHLFDRFAKPRKSSPKRKQEKATDADGEKKVTATQAIPDTEPLSASEREASLELLRNFRSEPTRTPEIITDEEEARRTEERRGLLLAQIAARNAAPAHHSNDGTLIDPTPRE
jgi:hypothetical protein